MTARDDYPVLRAWLGGQTMSGMNGDLAEVELGRALDEIDQLRAEQAEMWDRAHAIGRAHNGKRDGLTYVNP